MMTVLESVLPIVSRASSLAHELYRGSAVEPHSTKDLNRIAKTISDFALIVKQVGTIIKEDDRLPSHEAIETLEDIIDQCTAILSEVESTVISQDVRENEGNERLSSRTRRMRLNRTAMARIDYLIAHLDSLRSTLSVMLQTLYTAQSIMWAKIRPTISPQQGAVAVTNEKNQLETLIVEQQMSILRTSKIYEPARPEARLLMEQDSSQSLVAALNTPPPQPADLFRYQDRYIASLDTSDATEEHWLPSVFAISQSHLDKLLERWTRLHQFEEKLKAEEKIAEAQKREAQQPSVESESEDEIDPQPKYVSSGARLATPKPRRSGSVQPLFTESTALPIPFDAKFGPTAPLSPASSYGVSPKSSGNLLPIPTSPSGSALISPRSSISSQPVEAAAAVEAQAKDDEVSLEIPWTLCTRKHYWKYIDGKIKDTNTDLPVSVAFSERNSWTEVMASWVCKQAIHEAEYNYTQVQKEQRDGRRTRFETCFCIEQPLTFDKVHRLVERTVDIYRQTQPRSPPPRERERERRRESFDRVAMLNVAKANHDRDRTPLANPQQHPPLERSTTSSFPFPPPPPPLDRSISMPGAIPAKSAKPPSSGLHLPMPPAPYSPPQGPYSPQVVPYSPPMAPYSPSTLPPPYSPSQAPYGLSPTRSISNTWQHPPPQAMPQSPLRHSDLPSRHDYSSTSGTSDSDDPTRSRKHRPRSRDRSHRLESSHKKKGSGHGGAGTVGALVGIGGLTALLDGLSGL